MKDLTMVWSGGVVGLRASLGGESEGQLLAAWLSDDGFNLVNNILSINKLGNIEANIVNLVLALDLGDLNGLGDTDLLRGWVGEGARDLKRIGDQWNLVSLGLVFLMTHLVFSSITGMSISISSSSTSGDLHGLRLVLIGDLGGCAWSGDILLLIDIGTDFSVNCGGSLLTDGQNSVKAVVFINNLLDSQSDGGHRLIKARCTNFRLNGCVGISTQKFWSISVSMRLDRLVCSNS